MKTLKDSINESFDSLMRPIFPNKFKNGDYIKWNNTRRNKDAFYIFAKLENGKAIGHNDAAWSLEWDYSNQSDFIKSSKSEFDNAVKEWNAAIKDDTIKKGDKIVDKEYPHKVYIASGNESTKLRYGAVKYDNLKTIIKK